MLLSLALEELKARMAEKTRQGAKPVHICASPQGSFSAVWHHNADFLVHFLIQEGSLEEVLAADKVRAEENYFPDLLQVYKSNNTPNALAIWRKGFGERYPLWDFTKAQICVH